MTKRLDSSMPDAPLRLSLEEAITRLSVRGELIERFEDGLWMVHDGDDARGQGETWPEAVSAALGQPVVERDDKAELVKALEAARALLNDNMSVEVMDFLNQRIQNAHQRVLNQIDAALESAGEL